MKQLIEAGICPPVAMSVCLSILHVCLSHGDTVYRQCAEQPNNGEQACSPFRAYRLDTNCSRLVFVHRAEQIKTILRQRDGRKKDSRGCQKRYIRELLKQQISSAEGVQVIIHISSLTTGRKHLRESTRSRLIH